MAGFEPTAEQCVMCTKNHRLKEKAKCVPRRTGDTKRQQQTVAARLKKINRVSPAPM
jgi:ribosomal protein S18